MKYLILLSIFLFPNYTIQDCCICDKKISKLATNEVAVIILFGESTVAGTGSGTAPADFGNTYFVATGDRIFSEGVAGETNTYSFSTGATLANQLSVAWNERYPSRELYIIDFSVSGSGMSIYARNNRHNPEGRKTATENWDVPVQYQISNNFGVTELIKQVIPIAFSDLRSKGLEPVIVNSFMQYGGQDLSDKRASTEYFENITKIIKIVDDVSMQNIPVVFERFEVGEINSVTYIAEANAGLDNFTENLKKDRIVNTINHNESIYFDSSDSFFGTTEDGLHPTPERQLEKAHLLLEFIK